MSLFKSKEEKVLDEIKKKKVQMDKLKEEIIKMGKLVLKDGKLTKVEDVQKEEIKTATSVPVQQEAPIDYTDTGVDEMVQLERMRRQQVTLTNTPTPIRQVSPQPLSQQDYQLVQQERIRRQQEQQYALQQQAEIEQQRQMEEYQQAQVRQQPQQYQRPVQQLPTVNVMIEMVTGSVIGIEVPGDKVESFIEALNLAIDNQSSFPMNNKVINGRNVVSYTLD